MANELLDAVRREAAAAKFPNTGSLLAAVKMEKLLQNTSALPKPNSFALMSPPENQFVGTLGKEGSKPREDLFAPSFVPPSQKFNKEGETARDLIDKIPFPKSPYDEEPDEIKIESAKQFSALKNTEQKAGFLLAKTAASGLLNTVDFIASIPSTIKDKGVVGGSKELGTAMIEGVKSLPAQAHYLMTAIANSEQLDEVSQEQAKQYTDIINLLGKSDAGKLLIAGGVVSPDDFTYKRMVNDMYENPDMFVMNLGILKGVGKVIRKGVAKTTTPKTGKPVAYEEPANIVTQQRKAEQDAIRMQLNAEKRGNVEVEQFNKSTDTKKPTYLPEMNEAEATKLMSQYFNEDIGRSNKSGKRQALAKKIVEISDKVGVDGIAQAVESALAKSAKQAEIQKVIERGRVERAGVERKGAEISAGIQRKSVGEPPIENPISRKNVGRSEFDELLDLGYKSDDVVRLSPEERQYLVTGGREGAAPVGGITANQKPFVPSKAVRTLLQNKTKLGLAIGGGLLFGEYAREQLSGDENDELGLFTAALPFAGLLSKRPSLKGIGESIKGTVKIGRPKFLLPMNEVGQSLRNKFRGSYVNAITGIARNREIIAPTWSKLSMLRHPKDHLWMKKNFKKLIENPGEVQAPSDRIRKAEMAYRMMTADNAQRLMAMRKKLRSPGGQQELDFLQQTENVIENYFQHSLTDEMRRVLQSQNGDVYRAMVKEMEARGIDKEFFIQDMLTDPYAVKKYGSVDFARNADFPDKITVNGKDHKIWEDNPFKVIPKQMQAFNKRLAVLEAFGDNATATKWAKETGQMLEREYGDISADAFRDIWQDLNGFPASADSRLLGVYAPVESVIRAAQLSLSALAQPLSYGVIAQRYGIPNTLKAFAASLTGGEKLRINMSNREKFAEYRAYGGWAENSLVDAQRTYDLTGISGSISRRALQAVGFERMNRHIDRVANYAAMADYEQGLQIIKNGTESTFKKMYGNVPSEYIRQMKDLYDFTDADIARQKQYGLTDTDKARIVQVAAESVNLRNVTGLIRPRWMSRTGWQKVMAYTQFTTAMQNAAVDAVSAAKRGNVSPLIDLTIGAGLTVEGKIALTNYLQDRAREDKNLYERMYTDIMTFGAFGPLGEIATRVKNYWDYDDKGVFNPPTTSPLFDLFDVVKGHMNAKQFTEKNVSLWRAVYRQYGRHWGGYEYLAERLRGKVYLREGKTKEGKKYYPGTPHPDKSPNTSKMLMKRAGFTGKKRVLDLIREENKRRQEANK